MLLLLRHHKQDNSDQRTMAAEEKCLSPCKQNASSHFKLFKSHSFNARKTVNNLNAQACVACDRNPLNIKGMRVTNNYHDKCNESSSDEDHHDTCSSSCESDTNECHRGSYRTTHLHHSHVKQPYNPAGQTSSIQFCESNCTAMDKWDRAMLRSGESFTDVNGYWSEMTPSGDDDNTHGHYHHHHHYHHHILPSSTIRNEDRTKRYNKDNHIKFLYASHDRLSPYPRKKCPSTYDDYYARQELCDGSRDGSSQSRQSHSTCIEDDHACHNSKYPSVCLPSISLQSPSNWSVNIDPPIDSLLESLPIKQTKQISTSLGTENTFGSKKQVNIESMRYKLQTKSLRPDQIRFLPVKDANNINLQKRFSSPFPLPLEAALESHKPQMLTHVAAHCHETDISDTSEPDSSRRRR